MVVTMAWRAAMRWSRVALVVLPLVSGGLAGYFTSLPKEDHRRTADSSLPAPRRTADVSLPEPHRTANPASDEAMRPFIELKGKPKDEVFRVLGQPSQVQRMPDGSERWWYERGEHLIGVEIVPSGLVRESGFGPSVPFD
jgi:hypothetical protein